MSTLSLHALPPKQRADRMALFHREPVTDSLVSVRLAPPARPHNSLIRYCKTTRDYLVPSVWGPIQKGEDPYAPQPSGGVSPRSLSLSSLTFSGGLLG